MGSWLTVHAAAERHPARLTITFAVGDLPEGWTKSRRSVWHRRAVAAIGAVLIVPFVALIAAALLRTLGDGAAYQWIASSNVAIVAATISLFIGIPVAFVTNLLPITRLGVRGQANRLEGLFALEVAPLHLVVAVAALLMAVLFVGHLAADSYACWNGMRSAC